MPFISDLIDTPVLGTGGRRLGRVADVLFAPREPRAVGYAVRPTPLLLVFERKTRYLPWAALSFGEEGAVLAEKRLPSLKAGERALGRSWDETVQWRGMPVRAQDGSAIGAVADARVGMRSGAVRELRVSTGVVGDIAVGRLEVDGRFVEGFDGAAVRVLPGYDELESTGGLAAASGKGVAAVKVHGGRAAAKAYDAGVSAAIVVGRSFKHGKGRKMVDKLKKLMDEPDEE